MNRKERRAESSKRHYLSNKEKCNKRSRDFYIKKIGEDSGYSRRGLEKWKEHNRRHRQLWRKFILAIGYGTCSICNYDKCFDAIDFHHTHKENKEVSVGNIISRRFSADSVKRFLDETDKCIVLCANCHREIHSK